MRSVTEIGGQRTFEYWKRGVSEGELELTSLGAKQNESSRQHLCFDMSCTIPVHVNGTQSRLVKNTLYCM